MDTSPQLKDLQVVVINAAIAKKYILQYHYMRTFPNPVVCFGVLYQKKLCGVVSFGYSTYTAEKVARIYPGLKKSEIIELQRMNVSDLLGHNTESWVMSQIYRLFKANTEVRLILTHAGGCKNDCGILYQCSNWLYFGKEKCNDFYLTKAGEYKNIVAPRRYGQVPIHVKTPQQTGEYLYGEGEIVDSWRYFYVYPIDKKIRKAIESRALPYPKDSAKFRKDQKWVEQKK